MNSETTKIQGIVSAEMKQENEHSVYRIRAADQEYEIISSGLQAVKDNLFIRKGQYMEIEVAPAPDRMHQNRRIPLKSRIKLNTPTNESNN